MQRHSKGAHSARARTSHRRQLWTERLVLLALIATLAVVVTVRSVAERGEERVSPEQAPVIAIDAFEALSATAPPAMPVPSPVWALPPEETPARVARYGGIDMTEADWHELAAIVYLESANQSAEGQQAVAEVVFNRVVHPDFPDTVHDVLHQGEGTDTPQFSTIGNIHLAEPTEAQYDAIYAALYGDSILPLDVVFFSRGGENDRVWGKIGDHVFCYEYIWE